MRECFCVLRYEYSASQKSAKYRVVIAGGISTGRYAVRTRAAKNLDWFDARDLIFIQVPVSMVRSARSSIRLSGDRALCHLDPN